MDSKSLHKKSTERNFAERINKLPPYIFAEMEKLILGRKINHGNNPVLRWCADNVVVEKDPAENIKPTKAKAKNRIDGIVALIMALSRGMVHQEERSWDGSVVWL